MTLTAAAIRSSPTIRGSSAENVGPPMTEPQPTAKTSGKTSARLVREVGAEGEAEAGRRLPAAGQDHQQPAVEPVDDQPGHRREDHHRDHLGGQDTGDRPTRPAVGLHEQQ
ncbi:MAG TPA: hypothetical protein VHX59_26935 [Mycobacteriales bacterium]|nr:hypothetical protein [Mycobacteriales bacterium]